MTYEAPQDIVTIARQIATEAHRGQVDKAGVAYIEHPKYVASLVLTPEEKATAYLHDVVEDTAVSLTDLVDAGMPELVVTAVQLLTHDKSSDYFEYLALVKANPIARTVKLADLVHNSDISRLTVVTATDKMRLEKYAKARKFLTSLPK